MIPAHEYPSDQLASFVPLARRLLPCTGDRYRLGNIEVVLHSALPAGVALFVGRSGQQHDDKIDAQRYALLKP
jgi:hypothetical protein